MSTTTVDAGVARRSTHRPSPGLFRALSLAERASTLPTTKAASLPGPASPSQPRAGESGRRPYRPGDRSASRYERWAGQHPFGTGALFTRRLVGVGLDDAGFRTLLADDDADLCARHPRHPAWLTELAKTSAVDDDEPSLPLAASVRRRSDHGFLLAVAPLVAAAHRRLVAGVARWSAQQAPDCATDVVSDVLAEEMQHAVLNQIERTLVLELHVARIEGRLCGESSEERFRSFTDRYRSADARTALFEEYPVLGRLVACTLDRCVQERLEFLHRWSQDRRELATLPGGPLPHDQIAEVQSLGDPHRGGRTVLRVRHGSGAELIYKPKPLGADAHFQRLLEWLNDHGWRPVFRSCRVLDRGSYGWMPRLKPAPCASRTEVARFYQRLGGYLALLQALGATDLHFENLIAVREHPMLIDLETLFHPALTSPSPDAATDRAHAETADSVLSVGLLPESARLGAGPDVDVSALGAPGELISPEPLPCWVGSGTDAMHLERKPMRMPIGEHRPTLGASQQRIEFAAHVGDLLDGFDRMYDLLVENRELMLGPEGPLALFGADTTRVVLRPTHSYHVLHREAEHPNLLRDALDRDRHLDRLWAGVAAHPALESVVGCEHHDLWWGDIPLFTTRPDSRDLWCSRGHRVANYLPETGLALAERRLRRLGPTDRRRQHWFIRAAIGQSLSDGPGAAPAAAAQLLRPRPLASGSTQDVAVAIGDRLIDEALVADGHATWLGEIASPGGGTTIGPIGTDLYAGLSGIALFLAALGNVTGDTRHLECARAASRSIRAHVGRGHGTAGIGGYAGWGGVIYTLSHLSVLLAEPTLASEALELAGTLRREIDSDDRLDVVSGAAGLLLAVLSLHRVTGSPIAIDLATRCGDRLVSAGREIGDGTGWLTPGTGTRPLAGMSHGAAGIALALLQLDALTNDARYRATAIRGMRYERALFDGDARQWPDLRGGASTPPTFTNAWCHGAPGIGLARLATLEVLDDLENSCHIEPVGAVPSTARQEIDAAVATTLREGFAMNHSLCHGALGNLELPSVAAGVFRRADWSRAVARALLNLVDHLQQCGPVCGSLAGLESPGLMTGLAGIGYGLLRLTHPDRVPSVLTLGPPVVPDRSTRGPRR